MGFREATQRNQKFQKSTSISTSNINKVNVPPVTKRPSNIGQHTTDWRLKDIVNFGTVPTASAARGDDYKVENIDTSKMSVFDENNPEHMKNSGLGGGLFSGWFGEPSYISNVANAETQKQTEVIDKVAEGVTTTAKSDTFKPTPNIEKTDNFNEFVAPSSVGQFQDDSLLKEISASRDKNPDAFVGLGAWSKPQSTMNISGGASGFDKALHGKVQTQLNRQDLNREMKDVNTIWRQNFVLTFGQEGAPTKAEARDWINQQKQKIGTRDNIGGYNYGGYQKMYMDDLEDRFTNLYSMGNKDNKNRKLTKAEELSNIQQERDLTEKERQQLGTLTGTLEKPKKKKIEYAADGTWVNPFPNNTNFGGYEQFL